MDVIEERLGALNARLEKGSTWLDGEASWLDAHEPGTEEYVRRHGEYVRQQDRWTTMVEELTTLTAACPHTRRELVRLVDADGTSYPYVRCTLCRNNVAGPGVYLAPDAPRLAGVVLDGVPVSGDYRTPSEETRLAAANATASAFEALGDPGPTLPLASETRDCPGCGGPMALRSGTARTTGRPWEAWMCEARCGQAPQWTTGKKTPIGGRR